MNRLFVAIASLCAVAVVAVSCIKEPTMSFEDIEQRSLKAWIEKNHKEVMFLYSMLDDKQKEIMKTVRICNDANKEAKDLLADVKSYDAQRINNTVAVSRPSALDQLTALSQKKQETDENAGNILNEHSKENRSDTKKNNVTMHEINESALENVETLEDTADNMNDSMNTTMDDLLGTDLEDVEDVFAEIDQTDINFDDVLEDEFKENENSNDIILEMYRNGNGILEIAKQLGLGVGEVKLVIDLYQGA
jgi:hypothetical protein